MCQHCVDCSVPTPCRLFVVGVFHPGHKILNIVMICEDMSILRHHYSAENIDLFLQSLGYIENQVSMIRKYHNHTLQTNPWHREEKTQTTYCQETSGRQLAGKPL